MWCRRFAEETARGTLPDGDRNGVADRDLEFRRLLIFFEPSVKALLRLGKQRGNDVIVDVDDVELNLVLGLPRGSHLRRRRSGARKRRASAKRQGY